MLHVAIRDERVEGGGDCISTTKIPWQQWRKCFIYYTLKAIKQHTT